MVANSNVGMNLGSDMGQKRRRRWATVDTQDYVWYDMYVPGHGKCRFVGASSERNIIFSSSRRNGGENFHHRMRWMDAKAKQNKARVELGWAGRIVAEWKNFFPGRSCMFCVFVSGDERDLLCLRRCYSMKGGGVGQRLSMIAPAIPLIPPRSTR